MSDIGASDAGAVSEGAVSDAGSESFDLDAAVEEFANTAPDEWKGKASKIQSELKNLRGKYAPFRDRFDSLHEGDREAIYQLVDTVKAGDRDSATSWMLEAAKSLAGEKWDGLVQGLTPAEQQELAEETVDEASGTLAPTDVQKMIQDAIQADRTERETSAAQAERQSKINTDFQTLGYNIERNKEGRLTDFTTQQVAMLAINDHGGDIAKAHDAYQSWLGDQAKAYLQKHQGDSSLLAEGGTPTTTGDSKESLTSAQRAQARIDRLMGGPAS